jgi:putative transposase
MDDLFLLSEAQMRRINPHFPQSHGIARVHDRRVVSGIVFVIRNGLRWRDAPRGYGPHKTIYNRIRALEPIGRTCSTSSSPNWRARAASRAG